MKLGARCLAIIKTKKVDGVFSMVDYILNVHLKFQPANPEAVCHHPVCKSSGVVLDHVKHLRNYIARVYGITLRDPRWIGSR
jgi:hypothetical protein